jgi:cytochrome c-type biogenesis protein CcmF
LLALGGRELPRALLARVLAVQGFIGAGFLAFIVFTSNPFQRIDPAPLQGNGLNPLLQDPGLAFHPPVLYLGYVGFSVAFSFAIAALIEGRVDPAWARYVRPWTLAAWSFLTAGIALGSWWAYYELGWGGWWFWDPVENASFMPWLAGTALLHSVAVVARRDTLKSWTILLAIVTFSLSLLGTFLVRSGVLTSVHAFATDPARGLFILIFLVVVIGGSLGLFAVRAPQLKSGGIFQPISREGALVLNNLLFAAAMATVLLGTLYPLFLDALTGEKVSVGPPYFNATFVPIMIPLLLAMAAGPMLAWKRGDLGGVMQRLAAAGAASVAAAVLTWWLNTDGSLLGALGVAIGVWLAVATLTELAGRLKLFQAGPAESFARARGLPRSAYGMTIAHLGMAVTILGISVSGNFSAESERVLRPGERVTVGRVDYVFLGAEPIAGPNYTANLGRFRAEWPGGHVDMLDAEVRRYTDPPMETTEAAIHATPLADLYAVVGQPDGKGGYATRLYYKPLVSWIWLGALIMMAGGLLSASDRRARMAAPRPAPPIGAHGGPYGGAQKAGAQS